MRSPLRPLVILAVLSLGSACSDPFPAGGPGADGGTGGAGGTGGTGGTPAWAGLVGHWVDETIGDCIHGYDWWSFDAAGGVRHTVVDDSYCGPHSIEWTDGGWTADGNVIVTDLADDRFEGHAAILGAEGGPYLDRGAFVAEAGAYLHRHHRRSPARWPADETVLVNVRFEPEDAPRTAPAACRVTIALEAEASTDGAAPLERGEGSVTLPCSFEDADAGHRTILVGTGAWNELPDFTRDHPPAVAAAMNAAFPRSFLVRVDDPSVLGASSASGQNRWLRWSPVPPGDPR